MQQSIAVWQRSCTDIWRVRAGISALNCPRPCIKQMLRDSLPVIRSCNRCENPSIKPVTSVRGLSSFSVPSSASLVWKSCWASWKIKLAPCDSLTSVNAHRDSQDFIKEAETYSRKPCISFQLWRISMQFIGSIDPWARCWTFCPFAKARSNKKC